jgi:putative CocE/NonD family hydrolase
MRMNRRTFGASALASSLLPTGALAADKAERVSAPGSYRGYTEPVADGFHRTSEYITMRDGRRIAADIFLPTRAGKPLGNKAPGVLMLTGYRRSWIMGDAETQAVKLVWPYHKPGEFVSWALRAAHLPDLRNAVWPEATRALSPQARADWVALHGSAAELLLLHGYPVIVGDTRTTGASFGTSAEQSAIIIGHDIADMLEAFSKEPWSDGTFGMMGASWLGAVQHMALSYGTPRLKAVIPQVAPIDQYLSLWPGGVFTTRLMRDWFEQTTNQDRVAPALPVDDDPKGLLRDAAVAERKPPADAPAQGSSAAIDALLGGMAPLSRDQFQAGQQLTGQTFADGSTGDLVMSPLDFAHANRSGIATYCWGGWWDIYAAETPVAFANLTVPKKLTMGPWHHGNEWVNVEALRWFDHWLKGVANGIMAEPPATLAIAAPGERLAWRGASSFPPKSVNPVTLALTPDRALAASAEAGSLSFTVDPAWTSGDGGRGGMLSREKLDYSGLGKPSTGVLRFTSAPYAAATELCGMPVLDVQMASSTPLAQLLVYLAVIGADGRGHMLSDGAIDLRYSAEQPAPYDPVGMPWRSYSSTDAKPLVPGERTRVRIGMTPIGWRIGMGDRLLLVVAGADHDNAYRAPDAPTQTLTLFTGPDGCRLTLPVLPAGAAPIIPHAFSPLPRDARSGVSPFPVT